MNEPGEEMVAHATQSEAIHGKENGKKKLKLFVVLFVEEKTPYRVKESRLEKLWSEKILEREWRILKIVVREREKE